MDRPESLIQVPLLQAAPREVPLRYNSASRAPVAFTSTSSPEHSDAVRIPPHSGLSHCVIIPKKSGAEHAEQDAILSSCLPSPVLHRSLRLSRGVVSGRSSALH